MILGIGFLLLVSLVISAVLSSLTQVLGTFLGGTALVAHFLDLVVSFTFVSVLFAMIYKFLPDVQIHWQDVWIGAAITSFLFTIGKFLIGLYLGTSGVTSIYGAAASLITILLWVYYSSLIFFLGAEFTHVYARDYGSGVCLRTMRKTFPPLMKRERGHHLPPKKTKRRLSK
jgi:membrane protein